MAKICSSCKEEKDESEFSKDKYIKDGLRVNCKDCVKEYNQKHYKENSDKIKEAKKYYREENKEKRKEYNQKNKDKIKKQRKEYREKNKEKIKEYHKQHYEQNKNKINQNHKQYYQENKDKIKEYRQENKEKINKYRKEKYYSDPRIKFRQLLSKAISRGIKRSGSSKNNVSIHEKLDYTVDELINHLFTHPNWEPWMTIETHGNYEEGKLKWQIDHIIPHSSFYYTDMDCQAFKDCWSLSNLQPLEALENLRKGNKIQY